MAYFSEGIWAPTWKTTTTCIINAGSTFAVNVNVGTSSIAAFSISAAGLHTRGPTTGLVDHVDYGTVSQQYSSSVPRGIKTGTAKSTSGSYVSYCGLKTNAAMFTLGQKQELVVACDARSYTFMVIVGTSGGLGAVFACDFESATCVEVSDPSNAWSNTDAPAADKFGVRKGANTYEFSVRRSDTTGTTDFVMSVIGGTIASVSDPATYT